MKKQFIFHKKISKITISKVDWESAERLLARLVAHTFAADHPELFALKKESKAHANDIDTPNDT